MPAGIGAQVAFDISTGWSPLFYPGCTTWLRADLGVTSTATPTQISYIGGGGAAGSSSILITEATSLGDTIVVYDTGSSAAITDTSGNTYTLVGGNGSGGYCQVCVSAKAASASTNTLLTGGSNIAYGHYRNVAGYDTLAASVSAASGSSSNPNPGNLTITQSGSTIVAFSYSFFGTTETAGAGYALRFTTSQLALQDFISCGNAVTTKATSFGTSSSTWEAAAMTLYPNYGGVTALIDQSGNGNNMQANGPSSQVQLINSDPGYGGKSTFQFQNNPGGQYFLMTHVFPGHPCTVYLVGESSGGAGQQEFYADTVNNTCMYAVFPATSGWALYDSGAIGGTNGIQGSAQAFGGVYNGGTSSFYINSSTVGVANGSIGTSGFSGGMSVGGYYPGAVLLNGKIAELIVYNSAHTPAQVSQVFQYFAARYGGSWI